MRRFAIFTIVGVSLLAGCTRKEVPTPQPRPPREVPRPPVSAAPGSADYVATASSIDLFAIRSAEMALTRSRNERIRDAARAIIDSHRGTSGQLSFAGRRLNLLPSATMQPLHRRLIDELTLAVNFDRAWIERQTSVHRSAVELHGAYAARGESPTLRPVAAAALPIERRHLERLRSLR
jgi:putative membrane protein